MNHFGTYHLKKHLCATLEARLKAAGVGGQNRKADDVLARLKAKKNAAQE